MTTETFFDLLAEYGLDPEEASGGNEIVVRCSQCEDTKPRMFVNATTGLWLCFHCEERGNAYSLLIDVLEIEYFQAMRKLDKIVAKKNGRVHIPGATPAVTPTGITMPDGIYPLTTIDSEIQRVFWDYLHSRGVSDAQIIAYKMGWCITGLFSWRVIIPVYSKGVLHTIVARSVGTVEPKTRHPAGATPGHALFNIDHINGEQVVMVEGVFDALCIQQVNKNVVATLGTNLSAHQRGLLRDAGVKMVYLMWDGDAAGRTGMARVAHELQSAMFHVKECVLPEGVDPGSASWDAISEAIMRSEPPDPAYISSVLTRDRLDARVPKG